MDGLGLAAEIQIELVHEERSDRGGEDGDVHEHVIQRLEGILVAVPETGAVQADVPVGDVVAHEGLDETAGGLDVVILIGGLDLPDERVQLGSDPAVDLGAGLAVLIHIDHVAVDLDHLDAVPGGPPLDVRVQREEGVGVVQGAEELAAHFVHAVLVELEVVPRLSVGQHVPAEGVGAVTVQRVERVHGVAPFLSSTRPLEITRLKAGVPLTIVWMACRV